MHPTKMVVKVYVSGITASKEVKKRQQRALLILDTLKVDYQAIDITEPGNEEERDRFMEVCKKKEDDKIAHPPQFFNEDKYCGDWDDFFQASDDDTILTFLGVEQQKTAAGETNGFTAITDSSEVPAPVAAMEADTSENDAVAGQDESLKKTSIDEGIGIEIAPPVEKHEVQVEGEDVEVKEEGEDVEQEEEEIDVTAANVQDIEPILDTDVAEITNPSPVEPAPESPAKEHIQDIEPILDTDVAETNSYPVELAPESLAKEHVQDIEPIPDTDVAETTNPSPVEPVSEAPAKEGDESEEQESDEDEDVEE